MQLPHSFLRPDIHCRSDDNIISFQVSFLADDVHIHTIVGKGVMKCLQLFHIIEACRLQLQPKCVFTLKTA